MPSEYEALVAALKLTDIPFAEYGWKNKPKGTYGVVSLDLPAGTLDADNEKKDRAYEASVDVFFYKLSEREDVIETVEEILTEICGNSWEFNSLQHESGTGLFHIEWVADVLDLPEPEPEPEDDENLNDPDDPGGDDPGDDDPESTETDPGVGGDG